jgi:hypothetical protein
MARKTDNRLFHPVAIPGIVVPTHSRKAAAFTAGAMRIHSGIPAASNTRSARSH